MEKDIDYHFDVPPLPITPANEGEEAMVYHPLVETYLYIADELIPELTAIETPVQGLEYL